MRKKLQLASGFFLLTPALSIGATRPTIGAEEFTGREFQLRRPGKAFQSKVLDHPLEVPAGMAHQLDVWLDPVVRPEGNMQVDAGHDYVLRRPPGETLVRISVGPRETQQDVAVVCVSPDGRVQAELTVGL